MSQPAGGDAGAVLAGHCWPPSRTHARTRVLTMASAAAWAVSLEPGPAQQHWRRTPEPKNILHTEVCGRQHAITVVRDPCTGEVRDFVEQRLALGDTGNTAKNSSSMKRALAPPDSSFRGSAANYPFWPGGMELPEIGEEVAIDELDFAPDKLLHCPPGI